MAEQVDAAGMPTALGPVDYLLHRGEANPRTRSGIMALEILDTTPDWDRFRTRFENASRRALRLRQKVVVPTLPTAAPRWVVDPDFNLDYPRAQDACLRTRHAATGIRPCRADAAIAAGHRPTAVDGHSDRGSARRQGRHAAAPVPRGDRRCRQRGDVRPHLRPRARSGASADADPTHTAGSDGQRFDARRAQPPAPRTWSTGPAVRCGERRRWSGER